MCGFPSLLNRIRSIALASVTVPTVDRCVGPDALLVDDDRRSQPAEDVDVGSRERWHEALHERAVGLVDQPLRLRGDGRLLDDLGFGRLDLLEDPVEVLGGQEDPAVGALRHHLGDGAALVLGDAGVDGRGRQEDRGVGLGDGPTVIQRIVPCPTSPRTSKPRMSR